MTSWSTLSSTSTPLRRPNRFRVSSCAALEDTLKRFGRLSGVDVDDKVLQEVIAALKSKGLVSGAQKSLLDVMPKIRDFAMHANWSKIQDADVRSVLGF